MTMTEPASAGRVRVEKHRLLPPPAAAKLAIIDGQAIDARDAATSAKRRRDDIHRALHFGEGEKADAAQLEPEMARLEAQQTRENDRYRKLGSLAGNIRTWMQGLRPDTVLVMARPLQTRPNAGESILEAIERLRNEIREAQIRFEAVRIAAPLKEELKATARDRVAEMASRGRPTIRAVRGGLQLEFGSRESYTPANSERVAAMLAWLQPDVLIARLESEIDALPDAAEAMSAQEKQDRKDLLLDTLDDLERREEALIEKAQAQGSDILRRTRASPLAVLGVRIKAGGPLQIV